MSRKMLLSLVIFTLVVCSLFVYFNPVVLADTPEVFDEGEVFTPVNGEYDFRSFRLNDSQAQNFTVKSVTSGHTVIVDETGSKVINVLKYDDMVFSKRSQVKGFIDGELSKTGWMVDGVFVHEIELRDGIRMYSACAKDTSTGTFLYIASPSDSQTASLVNSLSFD